MDPDNMTIRPVQILHNILTYKLHHCPVMFIANKHKYSLSHASLHIVFLKRISFTRAIMLPFELTLSCTNDTLQDNKMSAAIHS